MPVPILESELQNEEFSQTSVEDIIAAAEKTRSETSSSSLYNDDSPLHSAMWKFTKLNAKTTTAEDIFRILRINLLKLNENPHTPYIKAEEAIAAAKWYAEHTNNEYLKELADKTETSVQLSFATKPETHVYVEQ